MEFKNFNEIDNAYLPLVFITAMRPESQVLPGRSRFHEIRRKGHLKIFQHSREPVYLYETGMGLPDGPEPIFRDLKNISPKLIINYGICGALESGAKNFDTFIIESVCHETAGRKINLQQCLPENLAGIAGNFRTAALLTCRQPVDSIKIRGELFDTHRCLLVDMELFNLQEIAANLKIPLLSIKVVSDQADEDSLKWVKENKSFWQNKLTGALFRLIKLLEK